MIPRQLLGGLQEVEIRREDDRLIVEPVKERDPIFALGSDPIDEDIQDASVGHDRYLYR